MIKVTVTAVALALALTACGGPIKMGAAATLGDDRISDSQYKEAIADWRDAYKASPFPAQELKLIDPESIERTLLIRLISFRVGDRAAKNRNIKVTPAQIDSVVAQLSGGQGQKGFDLFSLKYGIPPEYSRDFARSIVINNELAVGATTQEDAQQRIGTALLTASGELGVRVNPRYGDYNDGIIAPPEARLSLPETGTK